MFPRVLASLVAIVVASFPCHMYALGRQVRVDFPGPPATVAALVKGSRLIVRAQIEVVGQPEVIATSPTELVGRYVSVKLIEILKQPVPTVVTVGQVVRVLQWGGATEVGTRLVETAYPDRLFEVGEDDVLCLTAVDNATWALAFNHSSCQFRFGSTGEMTIPNLSKRMPEFKGTSTVSMDTLRALIKGVR